MYNIGIDLGGTHIAAGITDDNGTLIIKDSVPTALPRSAEEIINDIAELAKLLLSQAEISMDNVNWVGIGCPGTANCEEDISKVSGKTAFSAARAGDIAGKLVVDKYIRYLGIGLVNIINIFQPDVLCLGGGVSKEGDYLIKPLEAIIEKERYSKYSVKQTKLCTAKLGNDAGIIGAAMLGLLYN